MALTDVARAALDFLDEAVELLQPRHALLLLPALLDLEDLVRLLTQLLLHLRVRRQVVHAVCQQIIRRVYRARGQQQLQVRLRLDVRPLFLRQRLQQPLAHVVRRLLGPRSRHLHRLQPFRDDWRQDRLRRGEVSPDLSQLADQVLTYRAEPLREELQLDDGGKDVYSVVDAGVHPFLLPVDGRANESPSAESRDDSEREGLEFDGCPVWGLGQLHDDDARVPRLSRPTLAFRELGRGDVLELLFEPRNKTVQVLRQFAPQQIG